MPVKRGQKVIQTHIKGLIEPKKRMFYRIGALPGQKGLKRVKNKGFIRVLGQKGLKGVKKSQKAQIWSKRVKIPI